MAWPTTRRLGGTRSRSRHSRPKSGRRFATAAAAAAFTSCATRTTERSYSPRLPAGFPLPCLYPPPCARAGLRPSHPCRGARGRLASPHLRLPSARRMRATALVAPARLRRSDERCRSGGFGAQENCRRTRCGRAQRSHRPLAGPLAEGRGTVGQTPSASPCEILTATLLKRGPRSRSSVSKRAEGPLTRDRKARSAGQRSRLPGDHAQQRSSDRKNPHPRRRSP